MAEEEKPTTPTPEPTLPSPPESPSNPDDPPPETPTPPAKFDPSRMIGIIKRKALIKDLAAAYHSECIAYCRELLELQKRKNEGLKLLNLDPDLDSRVVVSCNIVEFALSVQPFLYTKAPEDLRKVTLRSSSKRAKKKR
ncbi:hypothetical protein YC2023_031497 [Brassica napus]